MTLLIASLYYLCFLVLTGLAIFIYRKNPTARLNRYFALFALTTLGWLVTLYFFNRTPDTPALTVWGRANFAFAASFVVFNYLYLPEIARKQARHAKWILLQTALLVLVTLFTGWIDEVEHLRHGEHVTVFGPLFPLYIAHIAGYVGAALYLTFFANRKAIRKIRNQLSIIGLGIFLMAVIAMLTNLLLPYFFKVFALQEAGALSIIALLGTIAYAISAHQLFDIRVVIRRTVVFTILFALIVVAYSVLALLLRGVLLGGTVSDAKTNAVNLVTICIVGFAVEPLRKWLTVRTDQFLFKREYNLQKVLTGLTTKLNTVINLDEALEIFLQTLVKVLHLRHAVMYVFQPGEHGELAISRVKQSGYRQPGKLMPLADDPAIRYFLTHPETLQRQQLAARLAGEEAKLRDPSVPVPGLPGKFRQEHAAKTAALEHMDRLRATVAIPLFLGKLPLGLIFLGEKGSGDPYDEDDLSLLEIIGSQAVSAIQKAKLYEDDQAKSEFVSIASHELLTPIAAVQGWLSMALEEGMGEIDPQPRSFVEKAFNATRRLSSLVKDLLSVSQIEAGRMKFKLQRVEVGQQIEQALDQLHFLAEEKKLSLSFEKPARPLPAVLADTDRVMEVLINLVGNAIKYTPQGSITVRALPDVHGKFVRIEVSDTGLGMSKQERAHLFEKFYRIASPETTGIMGTGLGLYITKSTVEKMDGTIDVESSPGKGSTFSFTLPVFKVQAAESPN